MQYKKWTIKFISIFAIAFVLILTLLYVLKIIMFSYSDRMPNIRKINKEYRLNIVQDFIDFKFQKNVMYNIVIGDSQFYGFKQDEKDTFAYLLKSHFSNDTINLSIVDATEKDLIKVLKLLQEKKVIINKIIYNFNLSHFSSITQEDKLPLENLFTYNNIYTLKLQQEYWMRQLKLSIFNKKKSQIYDLRKYEVDRYHIVDKNNKIFKELLRIMKKSAKEVLVVFSPHSIESLEFSNYNIKDFKNNIERYKRIVKKEGCDVLDLTLKFKKKDFLDILHLSIAGHKKMTQSILKQYKEEK